MTDEAAELLQPGDTIKIAQSRELKVIYIGKARQKGIHIMQISGVWNHKDGVAFPPSSQFSLRSAQLERCDVLFT